MTPGLDAGPLDDLAARFTRHRLRLYAIAYRSLGSPWGADDAVQEVWLRLQRADRSAIDNLEAWLTTVTSRVCIDMIRQQASRGEWDADDDELPQETAKAEPGPLDAAMRADDLALAMQVMLDTLGPLERLALALHDVFALRYDEIAPIVERTPEAARQLASRARARLRSVDVDRVRVERQDAVAAFLDAARHGEFAALLQLLDPDVTVRSDAAAVLATAAGAADGAPLLAERMQGADAVARAFAGRATMAHAANIAGVPAAVYADPDAVRAAYLITFRSGRIAGIDVVASPGRLAGLVQ